MANDGGVNRNYYLIGLRLNAKLDQIQLAEKLGMSQSLVSKFENGRTPPLPTAKKIAVFFGEKVSDIFPDYRF